MMCLRMGQSKISKLQCWEGTWWSWCKPLDFGVLWLWQNQFCDFGCIDPWTKPSGMFGNQRSFSVFCMSFVCPTICWGRRGSIKHILWGWVMPLATQKLEWNGHKDMDQACNIVTEPSKRETFWHLIPKPWLCWLGFICFSNWTL